MTREIKGRPPVGKWHVELRLKRDFDRYYPGWYVAQVGIIKLKPYKREWEGVRLNKQMYDGFLLRWRYWLPWEKY